MLTSLHGTAGEAVGECLWFSLIMRQRGLEMTKASRQPYGGQARQSLRKGFKATLNIARQRRINSVEFMMRLLKRDPHGLPAGRQAGPINYVSFF